MKSKTEISTQFNKDYRVSKGKLDKQFQNTKECQAFYAGDFMKYKDSIQFSITGGQKKKALVQFNKVKPYVNAVKGFMAQNRREAKYIAKIESNLVRKQYSMYANYLKSYIRDNNHSDQIETQQDGDMLINGYGAIETNVSYGEGYATTDPNGEILAMRLDPESVWWDASARQPNLIDARFCGYTQVYELEDALDLFDDGEADDFEDAGNQDDNGSYNYLPYGGSYDKYKEVLEWADEESKEVKVHFYKWYEIETFYRAENPLFELRNPESIELVRAQMMDIAARQDSNGLFEFNPEDEILNFDASIKSELEEMFGDMIEIISDKRKVFYEAVCSGKKVFTAYPSICQQGFSIQFKTGDWDAQNKIWVGMVNSMKDPQMYYNKTLTELMFTISSNSKGGVMVEESAISDIRDFEAKYAKTDSVVVVKDGALIQGRIQPKKEPFTATGYDNFIMLVDQSFTQVNGIDKSFLGSSENRQDTAILQRQRIKQVVSTLACYFDSITLFQKMNARLMLDLMRVYAENNAGALFRILGTEGKEEFVRISQDKLIAEFDITITEMPQTQDEKREHAQALMSMGDRLMQIGDPTAKQIYAIAIKYTNLEPEDVELLRSVLTPEEEGIDPAYVQRLEQQVQELVSEGRQAELGKLLSEVALNQAKANETAAKTARELEKAAQTGLENDLIRDNEINDLNVNI